MFGLGKLRKQDSSTKNPSTKKKSSFDPRIEKAVAKLGKMDVFLALPALYQLPFALGPDEEPEFVLPGKLNGRKDGLLVATPRRVFFFTPGILLSFSVHELAFDAIKGIEYASTFRGGEISLSGMGVTLTVTRITALSLCEPFVAYIKQRQKEGG